MSDNNGNSRELEIFCAVFGDVEARGPVAIKLSGFLDCLQERFLISETFDTSLRGGERYLGMLSTFHPRKDVWRQRFYKSAWAFDRRSRRVRKRIASLERQPSAVLQVGAMFDAASPTGRPPTVVYTDYTAALSSEKPEGGRSPYSGQRLEAWLERERLVYEKAAHICVRSKLVRESILERYEIDPGKLSVVGGGANITPNGLFETETEPRSPTILFIGKDYHRKGGDLLLKAFGRIRSRIPDARLVMVTSAGDLVSDSVEGVQFMEPCWREEVIAKLFRAADVFVLPSRLETWGDVIVEAMAFGVPCVVTRNDAMPEIVDHGVTGFVVEKEDANAIAHWTARLLEDHELRQRLSASAREHYLENFAWTVVANRIGDVIDAIASQS